MVSTNPHISQYLTNGSVVQIIKGRGTRITATTTRGSVNHELYVTRKGSIEKAADESKSAIISSKYN